MCKAIILAVLLHLTKANSFLQSQLKLQTAKVSLLLHNVFTANFFFFGLPKHLVNAFIYEIFYVLYLISDFCHFTVI